MIRQGQSTVQIIGLPSGDTLPYVPVLFNLNEEPQMSHSRTCPDCKTDMEVGFVPDHYSQIIQSQWHPGSATSKTAFGNLKLDSSQMIPIVAFRCPDCGLIRHYAAR